MAHRNPASWLPRGGCGRDPLGHATLFGAEQAGHRLSRFATGPMRVSDKTNQSNRPVFYGRSKGDTAADVSGNTRSQRM